MELFSVATGRTSTDQNGRDWIELDLAATVGARSGRWLDPASLRRAQQDPDFYARVATLVANLINAYGTDQRLPSVYAERLSD